MIKQNDVTGNFVIEKSNAISKDQTYSFYHFTQEQLKHTLMPLGEFASKDEVRKIANELGLSTANKPDSQEICFVKDNDYGKFIEARAPERIQPGRFKDTQGNIIGSHHGITNYTIGQRKGLGIALGKPAYVVDIISEKNEVIIGENSDVFGRELLAEHINLIDPGSVYDGMTLEAQIRYHAKPSKAKIYMRDANQIQVVFEEPVRAITPGQAVVFYKDTYLLGGGTIIKKVR